MGQSIYSFFWWLAGANRKILKEHITDHDKYFQIGMAVLITALMAGLTGGFAFHYANNKGFDGDISLFTIIAGVFWGFIILSLDRFLVLSMEKQGNSLTNPTSYEKFQNFTGEFIFIIPRIVLAILIASVILEPLELFLFKDQITNHISIIREEEKAKFMEIKVKESMKIEEEYVKNKKIIESKYRNLIEPIDNEIKNLEETKDKLRIPENILLDKYKKDLEDARTIARENRKATIESRNNGGCKQRCTELGQKQVGYDNEVHDLINLIHTEKRKENLKISENENKILEIEQKIDLYKQKVIKLEEDKSNEFNNFVLRKQQDEKVIMDTKEQYKNEYQGNNIILALKAKDALFKTDSGYKGMHILLTLLLITIELLPLIVKLLLKRSSYDAHIQRISYEEAMKHDSFVRDEKLKYQMLFKSLVLEENIKYEQLDKEFKKVKFSSSE